MTNQWEIIHHILEAMGLFFIPFVGWTLMTIIAHSKQIIILESKVNDSLDRRMFAIEVKMNGFEDKLMHLDTKIEKKIDAIEENVIDCKLSINNAIAEKFDILMALVNERRKNADENH